MSLQTGWRSRWIDARTRAWASRAFQIFISLALILWLASGVDSRTIEVLTTFSPAVLGLSLAIFATSQVFGAFRLWVLLRGQEINFPPSYLIRLTFVGFFANNFLPSTVGGDIYKAVALTRSGHDLKIAIVTLVTDRVLNLLAVAILTATTILFTPFRNILQWQTTPLPSRFLVPAVLICLGTLLVSSLLIVLKSRGSLSTGLNKAIAVIPERALRLAANPSVLAPAILLSILSVGASILAQFIIAKQLDMPVDIVELTTVAGMVTLAALMPVSINGIGLQEAGFVALLQLLGVALGPATAFAIFSRVLILGTSLVGAALLLLTRTTASRSQE